MAGKWPTTATDADLYIAVNELQNNLSGAVNASVTSLALNSATSFPTVGLVLIDNEVIKYTGISTNTLTGCTRGFDGTTAAAHSSAAIVSFAVMAAHHNVLKDEIEAIEADLAASFVGGSTSIATTFAKYLKLTGGTMSGAIAMGANNISGIALASGNTFSAAGVSVPGSGSSLELLFSSGSGIVQAYNRTGGAALPLILSGSAITMNDTGATLFASFGSGGSVLRGTTTNDAASTGYIGETVSSVISATSMPGSGAWGDLTSISLTAGDWDVSVFAQFNLGAATSAGDFDAGVSTTSGNNATGLVIGDSYGIVSLTSTVTVACVTIPAKRFSLASTTTVYFKMRGNYSAGTPTTSGRISARRVR